LFRNELRRERFMQPVREIQAAFDGHRRDRRRSNLEPLPPQRAPCLNIN
jgi:hypothetical protein